MAYQKLGTDEIRLLSFAVEDDSRKSIRCTTKTVSLGDAPQFKALSYVWGNPRDTRSLLLNGEMIMVTKNLDSALRFIYPHEHETIWVDALCINQKDNSEKSQQVGLMSEIYGKAEQVLSWLGEPPKVRRRSSGSRRRRNGAVDMIQLWAKTDCNFDDESEVKKLIENSVLWDEQSWQEVQELFRLPFWSRRWILQELVLASSSFLFYGDKKLPVEDISKAVATWHKVRHAEFSEYIKEYALWSHTSFIQTRLYSKLRSWKLEHGQFPNLVDVLDLCENLKASDLRDQLYAVLNISAKFDITVDYEKSARESLTDFASLLIKDSNSLNWLQRAGLMDSTSDSRSNLPSWVPTWKEGQYFTSIKTGDASKGSQSTFNFADGLEGETNKFWLSVVGIECEKVIDVEPADIILKNPAKILGGDFARYQLHQKYPSGMPILQAIFRTMLFDQGWGGITRLHCEHAEFFDLAAAFLLMLQLMESVKAENFSHFTKYYEISVKHEWDLPDYAESFLFYTNQTPNGRSAQDILGLFLGYTTSKGCIRWPEETDNERGLNNLRRFMIESATYLESKLIMSLTGGYFGVGPAGTEAGDIVCVVLGCSLPLVLRKQDDHYILIGACFVLGFMDGEAVQMVDEGKRRTKTFNLR